VHRLSLSKAWGWFAANWSFYGFLRERAVHKKFSKKFIFLLTSSTNVVKFFYVCRRSKYYETDSSRMADYECAVG
jgi:hypothetical protein